MKYSIITKGMGCPHCIKKVTKAMEELGGLVRDTVKTADAAVIGPTLPQMPKKNDMYFRVIYVKSGSIETLIAVKDAAESWMHQARGGAGLTFDMD